MDKLFLNTLPRIIDISCVKQEHTRNEIDKMITAAKKHRFVCTFALPGFTSYLIEQLNQDMDIMVGGTVGFPSGGDTTESKVFQAKELLNMGCHELDMVINISRLKSNDENYVYHDMKSVVDTASSRPVKAILEVTLLTEEEIIKACKLAVEAGVAYVKTGTGWTSKPTTLDHIKLIKETVKNEVKIKAAGGIRDLNTLIEMYHAGCNRFGIGTDSALHILEEAKKAI